MNPTNGGYVDRELDREISRLKGESTLTFEE